jgi:D-alanyl-D-alanine carboxypeptidase
LLLALIVMMAILAGCTEAPENTSPNAAPAIAEQTPAPTAGVNAPTTSPEPISPTTEATPNGESTRGPAAHAPTHTATWPAESGQAPCGILLPLVPAGRPLTSSVPSSGPALDLVPESARPALERLLAAPETVGLAAFEIGYEGEGAYLNRDAPMPLASVVKIINLIAYAEAAAAAEVDPAEWISLDELGQTYLPRSDLGAHTRAVRELNERNLVALDPPSTPLEEIPRMMIRHSSNAAADYLHLRLGQEAIEQTVLDLGLNNHTAPCPWIGQFLIMANRRTPGDNHRSVKAYIDDPERYGRDAMQLAESYAYDADFRAAESSPGWRASFSTQMLFSDNLNAQASAADYAALMARLYQNGLSSDYANILVRRALEWPMDFPVNQELFSTIGLKDGSLPGVLTTAYYAQRIEDGAPVVVVLFYRDLPRNTYRQWRQDLPHDELARWLLSDPQAIPALRNTLGSQG